MSDFLTEFFINPLLANGWFNPVNTLLWGVILVIAAFLVYTRLLKGMKVRVDKYFGLAVLPFVFWASSTRVLRDLAYSLAQQAATGTAFYTDIIYQTGLVQQAAYSHIIKFLPLPLLAGFFSWIIALFPTPGSYVFTFLFALGVLLISLGIQRISAGRRLGRLQSKNGSKIPYWQPMLLIGLAACFLNAIMIPITNFWGMGMVLGIAGAFAAGFFCLTYLSEQKKLPKKSGWRFLRIFSRPNSAILSVHMLDSAATFVSVSYFSYLEQHPVPRLFIEAIGPWAFFLLKLVVLLPSLYIIDKYATTETDSHSKKGWLSFEGSDFRNFLKIVILILGLAPGLRDMLRLAVGV